MAPISIMGLHTSNQGMKTQSRHAHFCLPREIVQMRASVTLHLGGTVIFPYCTLSRYQINKPVFVQVPAKYEKIFA